MLKITPLKSPERQPLQVHLAGVPVGTLEPYESDQWHASLKLSFGPYATNYVLIQGFAKNPHDAIAQAVSQGIEQAEKSLLAIRRFAEAAEIQSAEPQLMLRLAGNRE